VPADWTDVSPDNYALAIDHNRLPFGGSSDLFVQVSDNGGELVTVATAIDHFGDVTLHSTVPLSGIVLVSSDMGQLIPSSGLQYRIMPSDWELDASAGDYFAIISNQDLPFAGSSDIILWWYDAGGMMLHWTQPSIETAISPSDPTTPWQYASFCCSLPTSPTTARGITSQGRIGRWRSIHQITETPASLQPPAKVQPSPIVPIRVRFQELTLSRPVLDQI
jgi:hypothetical protein